MKIYDNVFIVASTLVSKFNITSKTHERVSAKRIDEIVINNYLNFANECSWRII